MARSFAGNSDDQETVELKRNVKSQKLTIYNCYCCCRARRVRPLYLISHTICRRGFSGFDVRVSRRYLPSQIACWTFRCGAFHSDSNFKHYVLEKGSEYASIEGRSMVIGSIALCAYSFLVLQLLKRFQLSALTSTTMTVVAWLACAFGLLSLLIG